MRDGDGIWLFLGPSLSWDEARAILPGAVLRPPAQAGDVYLAVKQGARVVAIVDGVFERVPAVWHKEILYALSCGVHVFGASSMGALRAAELHPFGMVGVGRIFEAYRDGLCEDDDDVAVMHAPQDLGFAVLTEAMVNVRDALAAARARGLVAAATHDALAAAMKRRNYTQRRWGDLPALAAQSGLPAAEIAALQDFLSREQPNLKRIDAIELLHHLRERLPALAVPHPPGFEFEATVFWEQLVSTVRMAPSSAPVEAGGVAAVPIAALRNHLGVAVDDAEQRFEGALLMYLAVKETQRLGLSIDSDGFQAAGARLVRDLGLQAADEIAAWQQRNGLTPETFCALVELLALVEAVARHHATGLDAFLPAEMQRRGLYEAAAAAIEAKQQAVARWGSEAPAAADVGTTTEALLAWYESRYRRIEGTLQEHCDERRFVEPVRFVREVLAEYLAQRAADGAAP